MVTDKKRVIAIVIIIGLAVFRIGLGANSSFHKSTVSESEHTQETTKETEVDLNIPISGLGEDGAKNIKDVAGNIPIIDMPENPDSKTTEAESEYSGTRSVDKSNAESSNESLVET